VGDGGPTIQQRRTDRRIDSSWSPVAPSSTRARRRGPPLRISFAAARRGGTLLVFAALSVLSVVGLG
jgi:hypothetical protein